MIKMMVGHPDDPAAFAHVASTLRQAGRSAATFQVSVDNMVRALERARAACLAVIEQYYFDREAQLKWEDEGGPCHDRSE